MKNIYLVLIVFACITGCKQANKQDNNFNVDVNAIFKANANLAIPHLVYDTTKNNKQFNNNYYFSKTDFSKIDSLDLWCYKIFKKALNVEDDSIKPICEILFERTKGIDDGISLKLHGKLWTPDISFKVYKRSDSAFCYRVSNQIRYFSSCVPPNVGGDIIFMGNFIFVYTNVCVECGKYNTDVDYCRPVINYIFSKINPDKLKTINDLRSQLIIKEVK